jgi:hypothetical protein
MAAAFFATAAALVRLFVTASAAADLLPPPSEQCAGKPVNASSTPWQLNGTFTFPAVPAPRLVPFPRSLQAEAAYLPLGGCAVHVGGTAAEQAQLLPLARLFASEVLAATDGTVNLPVSPAPPPLPVSPSPVTPPPSPVTSSVILLAFARAHDPRCRGGPEAYSLVSTDTSVALISTSYAGMVSATATLLQAVERSFNVDAVPRAKGNCTTTPEWRLPALNIQDAPALPYRGIMVDAARAFLPLSALKGFVTMCRLYKLNSLHIHLTDDGAFSFPSTAFPELAKNSPWKYNLTELHELQAFASARNVEIIGEMDVPGHARSLVQSLPHVFGFPSKAVGVLDFTNASVVGALQTIFEEILQVFPSSYVHM